MATMDGSFSRKESELRKLAISSVDALGPSRILERVRYRDFTGLLIFGTRCPRKRKKKLE